MRPAANDLTRGEFLFLGALLDGQPRTREEIRAAGCRVVNAQFAKYVRYHERYGWIERGQYKGAIARRGRESHRQLRSAYRITDAGRRIWHEAADWWLFQIQSAQRRGTRKKPEPKPDFAVRPPLKGERGTGVAAVRSGGAAPAFGAK